MDAFGVLADPTRRSLLTELAAAPHRVADLAAGREISRPAISKHLRLLLEAGLVRVSEQGRERYYALDRTALAPVAAYVGALLARPLPDHALDALETEVRRTTRERTREQTHEQTHEQTREQTHERRTRDQHTDRTDRTA